MNSAFTGPYHGDVRRAKPLSSGVQRKRSSHGPIDHDVPLVGRGKAAFIIVIILLMNMMGNVFGEDGGSLSLVQSTDYGIFSSMGSLHTEQETRRDNEQVDAEVTTAFSTMHPVDHVFRDHGSAGFIEETIDVPEPLTKSPVVFDAVSGNPIIDDTTILDWALPPPLSEQGVLNYLVLTDSGGYQTWSLGSMVPRIGLVVDSSLDKWIHINVDGILSTGDVDGNDIRVRMTFGRDLLERDWDVTLFPPSINFNNAGIRIEIEALETQSGRSAVGGSVYFIKGISYDNKNYIWSVGVGLDRFMDSLVIRVQARQWRASPDAGLIGQLMGSGTVNINELNILEILGPYTISYEFRTSPEDMDIFISVIRVFDQAIEDRAYIKLGIENDQFHDRIVSRGSLLLNQERFGDPVDRVEWRAGTNGSRVDDTVKLNIRYTEFSNDLVDAHILIPVMPSYLRIDLEYIADGDDPRTVMDLNTRNGISSLEFLEAIYQNWSTTGGLDDIAVTRVRLKGIPRELHLETTAGVPLEQTNTSPLNLFDSFMSKLAGRFYRIGKIFREIPRAVADMPGRDGSTLLDCRGESILSIDYTYTTGPYLNSTGNFAAFLDHGADMPAISAHLEGLSYYKGSFSDGSDITLSLVDVPSITIYANAPDAVALVRIEDIPGTIHLLMSGNLISYDGSEDGQPARIGSIFYNYRDSSLFFDVNIFDIPSSLSMIRSDDQVEIVSGTGAIGTVEMFTGNSTTLAPYDLPERNFVSVRKDSGKVGVGLRLNKFRSIVYNNGTGGFLEISTVAAANFYALIKDDDSGLDLEAVFAPLPPFTHIDTPSVIGASDLGLPDILGIESISEYSDILLSLSKVGRAPLDLASGISRGLTDTIGQYSNGFSMSWDLAEDESNLDLFMRIEKKGDHDIEPAEWTHGIWIEQRGVGDSSSVNGNIFLKGMPTKGEVALSFSEKTISVDMDFRSYRPEFDWMLVRTAGVQDRDISIYLTGIENGMDFKLSMNITTDLSIGGMMRIDMDVDMKDDQGAPLDLGPMMATLRKSAPILSIRQMYLPQVPSEMHLEAYIGDGVNAEYNSSRSIDHLYFKITKLMSDRWSQVYAIFHDLPTSFSIKLIPTKEFTIQEPFPLQGLPSLEIKTSSDDMDIFIEYDGSGFGQRGRYKIYADNIGNTSTFYEGDDYVIESDGIGFLSIELERLPAMESFTLTSLMLLGNDVRRLKLSVSMGFGIYPIIRIDEAEGGSFQIKLDAEMEVNDRQYSPDLFFLNFRTNKILCFNVITGISVNRDNSAVNMDKSDGGIIMPAPVLTFWGWMIGEVL